MVFSWQLVGSLGRTNEQNNNLIERSKAFSIQLSFPTVCAEGRKQMLKYSQFFSLFKSSLFQCICIFFCVCVFAIPSIHSIYMSSHHFVTFMELAKCEKFGFIFMSLISFFFSIHPTNVSNSLFMRFWGIFMPYVMSNASDESRLWK